MLLKRSEKNVLYLKFTWSELTMIGSLRIIQVMHSWQGGVVKDPWYVQ